MLLELGSPRSSSDSDPDALEMTPTQLLSLAIKKRRGLSSAKDRDLRREVLQTSLIQNVCKYLGEFRARRRRRRSKRRQRTSRKRQWNEPELWRVEEQPLKSTADCMPGGADDIVQISMHSPSEDGSPVLKKACVEDDSDPFGLDDLFARYVYQQHQPRMSIPMRDVRRCVLMEQRYRPDVGRRFWALCAGL